MINSPPHEGPVALGEDAARKLREYGAATVHEVVPTSGVLPSALVPIVSGVSMCGPAFPVDTGPGDNLWIHRAIYAAPAGAVLVVSCGDAYEFGYWGEILSTAASARGLGGVLIDGSVRDADALQVLGFPVFARGLCVRGTGKQPGVERGIGRPVVIGEVTVSPGDVVLGDSDGVITIPINEVAAALSAAARRLAKEDGVLAGLRQGRTSLDLLDIEA